LRFPAKDAKEEKKTDKGNEAPDRESSLGLHALNPIHPPHSWRKKRNSKKKRKEEKKGKPAILRIRTELMYQPPSYDA